MSHLTVHQWKDIAIEVIATCSFLHTVLPPWDWNPDFVKFGLAEFPFMQKVFHGVFNNRWYRLIIYTIGYIALNARSTVWKFISVNNPDGPNANVSVKPVSEDDHTKPLPSGTNSSQPSTMQSSTT